PKNSRRRIGGVNGLGWSGKKSIAREVTRLTHWRSQGAREIRNELASGTVKTQAGLPRTGLWQNRERSRVKGKIAPRQRNRSMCSAIRAGHDPVHAGGGPVN